MYSNGIEKNPLMCRRYRIFDAGGHVIRSEHMNSCEAAEKRFILFKGPGSLKKNFNRWKCRGIKGLSTDTTLTPPPWSFYSTFKLVQISPPHTRHGTCAVEWQRQHAAGAISSNSSICILSTLDKRGKYCKMHTIQ
jgi:hypothetical protein